MTEGRDTPSFAVLDATGLFVKVETVEGSMYMGKLSRFDMDNGDVELSDVRCQHRDSSLSVECRVFIKGSSVRLMHLPSHMRKASFLDWANPSVQKELKESLKVRHSKRREAQKSTAVNTKKAKQRKLKKLL
ncbi:putative small nuclear ribonucleoprotein [Trypanosoma theileri]|uniref:Putative small nuclear ribonucleoprotein n=1 Tax=Trypanosoma theileri TaxID=67003 RepID=A0A1X0P880_9TRYP|nr:putative small nuclear ribonucleoprotein [Trypanosoma theileri]ORC93157.1 putative small nuclear ribonucleoprotein [Trypanosoma theileri]